jgi:hypothetical protein
MNRKISKKNMRTMDDYDDYDSDCRPPEYNSDHVVEREDETDCDYDDYVNSLKNPPERKSKYIEVKEIEYKYISLEYRLKMEEYFEYEEYYKELYPDYWGEFEKKYESPLTPIETTKKILEDGTVLPCFSPSFLRKSVGDKNLSYHRKRYSEKNIGSRHRSDTSKKNKNSGGARVLTEEEKVKAKERVQKQTEIDREKKLIQEEKSLKTERIRLEQLKEKDEKFNEYIKNIDQVSKINPESSGNEEEEEKQESEEDETEYYLSLVKSRLSRNDMNFGFNVEKEEATEENVKKETKQKKPKAVKNIEKEIFKSIFSQDTQKNEKASFSKTTMCKFGKTCSRKNTCNYAHDENELVIRKCVYDPKCVNPECKFYHIGDTKKQNIPTTSVDEKQMCKNGSNCRYGSKCKFKHNLLKSSSQPEEKLRSNFQEPVRLDSFILSRSYAEIAKMEPVVKVEKKKVEVKPLLILKPKSVEEMKVPGTWIKILNVCNVAEGNSNVETRIEINISQNVDLDSFQTHNSKKKNNRYKKINKEEKQYEKLTKTKLCLSVENNTVCPHGANCRYAHNIFEIVARPCRNGADCDYHNCRFAH